MLDITLDLVGSSRLEWLPDDYENSWTLREAVSRKGIGLHSGIETEVTLLPSLKEGFYVSWKESSQPPVKLNPSLVVHSPLCTTLELGTKKLSTVEHLLAALIGCGLTHAHILVNGNEIPLLDGSSIEWVEAIEQAGINRLNISQKTEFEIKEPLVIYQGLSMISAIPSDKFRLIGIIDFPYSVIGKQMLSLELTPQNFVEEIAPARTFGFKDQIDHLISQGLIKGGNLNNSLVCDENSWLNPPLRFENEPVRHKLLDLIGDLALIGLPKAQVLVYRGSHALHTQFAKAVKQVCSLK